VRPLSFGACQFSPPSTHLGLPRSLFKDKAISLFSCVVSGRLFRGHHHIHQQLRNHFHKPPRLGHPPLCAQTLRSKPLPFGNSGAVVFLHSWAVMVPKIWNPSSATARAEVVFNLWQASTKRAATKRAAKGRVSQVEFVSSEQIGLLDF